MKRISLLAVAVLMALGLVVPAAVGGPVGLNNKYSETEFSVDCLDGDTVVGTITYVGPAKMWPPNHKSTPISITATAIDSGDSVTLNTEGWHDETVDGEEMNGAGNTSNDVDPAADGGSATGSVTNDHLVRSERSGRGDGRLYTIDWQATFTNDTDTDPSAYTSATCGSADLDGSGFEPNADAFTIEVPHDMRGGADWKQTGNDKNGGNA